MWRRSPLTPLHVVRCQGDVTVFRRRVYSKYPKPKGDVQDYVLVHYLREKIQTKAPGVQGRSKHGRNALSKGVPSQGSAWPLSIAAHSCWTRGFIDLLMPRPRGARREPGAVLTGMRTMFCGAQRT